LELYEVDVIALSQMMCGSGFADIILMTQNCGKITLSFPNFPPVALFWESKRIARNCCCAAPAAVRRLPM
jgi:hypothetical protein